uniref:UspA domain-containing protein n=1 Tax=Solanum lycopersicum TaxID=4081 RepID=K4C8A0_SOLLC
MDVRKIVVVVEDVEIARRALEWTLENLLRYGDIITLLHIFCMTRSKSKKKLRLLRLQDEDRDCGDTRGSRWWKDWCYG